MNGLQLHYRQYHAVGDKLYSERQKGLGVSACWADKALKGLPRDTVKHKALPQRELTSHNTHYFIQHSDSNHRLP
jgi:hypothetical protein